MGSVLEALVRLCPIVFAEKKYVGRGWPEATKYWRKAFNRCASSQITLFGRFCTCPKNTRARWDSQLVWAELVNGIAS